MTTCKYVVMTFFLMLILHPAATIGSDHKSHYQNYNILWNSQSKNSMGSMPLNGHSIGCNVWVEKGDIIFYAAQSGAFDENNESLKMGRFRISLTPNPFENATSFRQELKLYEGYIEIECRHSEYGNVLTKCWIETERPVIHIDIESEKELEMKVAYETWRWHDVILEAQAITGVRSRRSSIFDFECYLVDMVKYGDSIDAQEDHLYFFHDNANRPSAFDFVVKQQELETVRSQMYDPLKNLISGGKLTGNNLIYSGTDTGTYFQTPYKSWIYQTTLASTVNSVSIYALVNQAESPDQWKEKVDSIGNSTKAKEDLFMDNLKWWSAFWEKSFIFIDGDNSKSKAWEIGRNYNLFRYQLGGNTYGRMPIKFNGGNLTVDPGYVDNSFPYDPDVRRWGGGSFTAQNQRLVYWPMLKSGDFDAMLPQFNFYKKALINASLRSQVYWGHGGCSFTEQMQQSGLPIASHYGFVENGYWVMVRPADYETGIQANSFVQTMYQTQLEFAFMILEYHRYSKQDISAYIPFIYNCIYFYDKHYQFRNIQRNGQSFDNDGNLVLYPTTPGENSPNSTNAADVIAGLKAVVNAVGELPAGVFPDSIVQYFSEVSERIPDIELYTHIVNGQEYLLFRESKEDNAWHAGSMPSLYVVFPYRLVTSEVPEFEYALNVWNYKMSDDNKYTYVSWRPGVFMGANLLLKNYAKDQIVKKLASCGRRYPTFWGPGHDWAPDHNWGGSGMIGLQDMLLQEKGGKIHLFPTWPEEWDVDFKLHAGDNTVVEGTLENGKVQNLESNAEPDQLIIDLQVTAGIQSIDPMQIQVFNYKDGFTIKGNIMGKTIRIYSILGVEIASKIATSEEASFYFNRGLYIIDVNNYVVKTFIL